MSNEKYKAGGHDFHPGRMEKSFDQWVEEEKKEHHMAQSTDEKTEGGKGTPVKETHGPGDHEQEPGSPKQKTPEEMQVNPEDLVNKQISEEMGAKHRMAFDHKKGAEWWHSVTSGKPHKISACMDAAKSFADDPGAFCGALAKEVGYKPE